MKKKDEENINGKHPIILDFIYSRKNLDFLMNMPGNDLETLVVCIRERCDQLSIKQQ